MALQPAICPQCGGKIQIDTDREKMFCIFCGTGFIVKDIINNHYEIHVNSINEKIINSAKVRMDRDEEYLQAFNSLMDISDQEQDNEDYWWQVIRASSCGFQAAPTIGDTVVMLKFINKYWNIHKSTDDENAKKLCNYLVLLDKRVNDFYIKVYQDYKNFDNIWPALERYKELCIKYDAQEDAEYIEYINSKYYDTGTELQKSESNRLKNAQEIKKEVNKLSDKIIHKVDKECWKQLVKEKIDKLDDYRKRELLKAKETGALYSVACTHLVYGEAICSTDNLQEVIDNIL